MVSTSPAGAMTTPEPWRTRPSVLFERASGTVRTWKMPGRSMPGSGGQIDGAPGDSTSLS